jgi:hypothetical protein
MKKSVIIFIFMLFTVLRIQNLKCEETTFDKVYISGHITDLDNNQPVESGIIKLYFYNVQTNITGFQMGANSNSKGFYKINLPLKLFQNNNALITAIVDAEGYYQLKKEIALDKSKIEINFKLKKKYKKTTQVFSLHHLNVDESIKLIEPYIGSEDHISYSEKLNTMTITDSENDLKKIEQIIKKYDIPLKEINLEVKFIYATGNGDKKPVYSKEIKSIAKKLSSLFKFGKYELIHHAKAKGLEGSKISTYATLPTEKKDFIQVKAELEYHNGIIKLENFQIKIYHLAQYNDISTTVNIKNGETIILGASKGDAQEGSIITVVTARVVE